MNFIMRYMEEDTNKFDWLFKLSNAVEAFTERKKNNVLMQNTNNNSDDRNNDDNTQVTTALCGQWEDTPEGRERESRQR